MDALKKLPEKLIYANWELCYQAAAFYFPNFYNHLMAWDWFSSFDFAVGLTVVITIGITALIFLATLMKAALTVRSIFQEKIRKPRVFEER